jgi:hypothetical protein
LTAQGHPRSIFKRAVENGNFVVAEMTARELRAAPGSPCRTTPPQRAAVPSAPGCSITAIFSRQLLAARTPSTPEVGCHGGLGADRLRKSMSCSAAVGLHQVIRVASSH